MTPPHSLFLNLSNHRLKNWTPEQKQAALDLGCTLLHELPFPSVDPTLNETLRYVDPLLTQLDLLLNQHQAQCTAAMVSGEYSLTIHLVRALQHRKIPCYMATNHRIVQEINGQKISQFRFIRFRSWPCL